MSEFINFWNEYKKKYSGKNISDKGTAHDYIESYYANEFNNIKDKELRLVEIGIGDGYSLILWREWFTKAEIFAIERYPYGYDHIVPFEIEGANSIFKDAYTIETVNMFEDNSIDYLIDDGPHTLESQLYCLEYWLKKIKVGGKIIIEDIQNINYIENFKKLLNDKFYRQFHCQNVEFSVFDFRNNKNRYDDIIFEVTKIDNYVYTAHSSDGIVWNLANVGSFYSANARIQEILNYFNSRRKLPTIVDSFNNFRFYKDEDNVDLCSILFKTTELNIPFEHNINLNLSYIYNKVDFNLVNPFIEKYFSINENVELCVSKLIDKYHIDFENTVYILYSGNDKVLETQIPTYDEFINKVKVIEQENPNIKFLLQTDELEFREAFLNEFNNTFFIEEIPAIRKDTTQVVHKTLKNNKQEFATYLLSSVICGSKCKKIVTSSSNTAFWVILFRNNSDGVSQYLNGIWYDS